MITATQLLCHFIGDYFLQSSWMANEKTKSHVPALVHVLTYMLPFLFLRPSWPALFVIVSTHFVIDRWRLARYVCWVKNFIGPKREVFYRSDDGERLVPYYALLRNTPWVECQATGYPPETPVWLATWLLIIVDNIMHVVINGLALRYL